MRWFRRLFRSADCEKPDRMADLAAAHQNSIETLESALRRAKDMRLAPHERASWHVLWIATAFRRGDRAEAFQRACAAHEALPRNAEVLFALAQEHEYRGELDQMLHLFRRCNFPQTPASHALAAVRYCYLRGFVPEGLELLQPVLDAHFSLRIADDTFLWIRRMPFVGISFGTAACLHLASGRAGDARDLIRRASENLSDCDLSPWMVWIDAADHKKPQDAAGAIQSWRAPHVSAGPLGGYDGTRYAAWHARTQSTLAAAQDVLSRVRLQDTDFAWLHDARSLAMAESCHRFGDAQGEDTFLSQFLARQPLLLEPNLALEFGFIDYQARVRTTHWLAQTGRATSRGSKS